MTEIKIQKLSPSKKLKLFCRNNNIKLFILFGSHSLNKNNENSDIDLAVLLNVKASPSLNKKIFEGINELFSYKLLDLVILNYADILLQFNVINSAKILFEKNKGDFFNYQLKVLKLYQDSKKFDKYYTYLIEKQIEKWKTTK